MSVCVQAEPSRQLFIIKLVMTALWQSNENKEESLILTLVIMKIEYLKT